MADQITPVETSREWDGERKYLFRGDDICQDGAIGRALGTDADEADIQNFADHVLRKETSRTSRFISFTTEAKIARRFTGAPDNRNVRKVEVARLRELEARGLARIWDPDQVHAVLKTGPRKFAKQAADVRTAMKRNHELLIEGQIPADMLNPAD